MSDLLRDARELRQRLYRLELLLEIEKGRDGRGWFEGRSPEDVERATALKRLSDTGLLEAVPPPDRFRLTPDGRDFLKEVRAKVTAHGAVDWTRADEIDFSRL